MDNFIHTDDIEDIKNCLQEIKSLGTKTSTIGNGKTLGMFFFNPSLRTRLSTQKAAQELGLNTLIMNFSAEGWNLEFEDGTQMNGSSAEHVKEAAEVMSVYCDLIAVRAFPKLKNKEEDYQERILNSFVKYASVPVINLESATAHPLQALADLYTISAHSSKPKPKVVLSWAPHPKALPQAVPNSFVSLMKKADVELIITHPKGYELDACVSDGVAVEYDQKVAFEDADFVYAKNWSSVQNYGEILDVEENWMIDELKMSITNKAKFMHCLPVRRNVVVTDEVLDSTDSIVMEQVKNRVLSAKWVLYKMLSNA